MARRIVTLPGDGIGPEIMASRARGAGPGRRASTFEEHLFGGASIDAHGTALTDDALAACRERRRRPAGRRRRPEVGHHRPRRAAARAGPARPAQGPRPVRQPAPGRARSRRSTTPARCAASVSRAPTCWSCASSPAGSTSASKDRAPPTAPSTHACTRASEIERHRAGRRSAPRAARVTSVDKANVLETSRLWREVVTRRARRASTRTSSSSTCSSTTPPCSSSPPRATST